jgi:6-phosphogluconate dehydrogenase
VPDEPERPELAAVAVVGMAVMGQNLALNLAEHGYAVAVFNRTTATATKFESDSPDWADIRAASTMADLVASLERPRRIILLLRAGAPVDEALATLGPLLDADDIVIDAGNSDYTDHERRHEAMAAHGVRYVGAGVSGGEEGARYGPSIMPGGDATAWPILEPMLTAIAAKAEDGSPCTTWIGPGGSGHYVKMVHNGIEYGDMQVLAEAVTLLRAFGLDQPTSAEVLDRWNNGRLRSFLVEITASILTRLDEDGAPLLPRILDVAGQKGTGRWTAINAYDRGVPLSVIAHSVEARSLSARLDLRQEAAPVLAGPEQSPVSDAESAIEALEAAVWAAKVISYAQGFDLLTTASAEHDWKLDLAGVARIWRAGCIIRATLLDEISAVYDGDSPPAHLLLAPAFANPMADAQAGLRATVAAAATLGLPVPALSSALAYYDGLRTASGSANLIQAQRDWFGAHTYERTDRPRGEYFHTDWVESGAAAVSGSYRA